MHFQKQQYTTQLPPAPKNSPQMNVSMNPTDTACYDRKINIVFMIIMMYSEHKELNQGSHGMITVDTSVSAFRGWRTVGKVVCELIMLVALCMNWGGGVSRLIRFI